MYIIRIYSQRDNDDVFKTLGNKVQKTFATHKRSSCSVKHRSHLIQQRINNFLIPIVLDVLTLSV